MSDSAVLIVNATPHGVTLQMTTPDGPQLITLPPSGLSVRVQTSATAATNGSSVLVRVATGDPEGLPAERPDVVFVVSTMVLTSPAAASRGDLMAPYNLQRGMDGQPSYCLQLSVSAGMTADTLRKVDATLRAYLEGARTPADDLARYHALVDQGK